MTLTQKATQAGVVQRHCNHCFTILNYAFYSGTGWDSYSFDPVTGPPEIFSRFFGTTNPYEALNGM